MKVNNDVFSWHWTTESGQSILFVTFHRTPASEDWRAFHAQAYADFAGGPVKLLSDSRLSENIVDHKDLIALFDDASRYGVTERFIANIVSDQGYFLKSDMINQYAKTNRRALGFNSFLDPQAAKAWLLSCSFKDLKQAQA